MSGTYSVVPYFLSDKSFSVSNGNCSLSVVYLTPYALLSNRVPTAKSLHSLTLGVGW